MKQSPHYNYEKPFLFTKFAFFTWSGQVSGLGEMYGQETFSFGRKSIFGQLR